MQRRTVLAALSATTLGLAGCVSNDDSPPDYESGTNNTETSPGGDDTDSTDNESREGSPETVVAHFEGEPNKPSCVKESEIVEIGHDEKAREIETAATVPYPDPPSSFTEEDVTNFLKEFEHAYVTKDILCDGRGSSYILSILYNVKKTETFDWSDSRITVFLLRAGAATAGASEDGSIWEADVGFSGVVYTADRSGVARAAFADADLLKPDEIETEAPDPLNEGELVCQFG